ncbi:ABC transporter ATP-binding protein [Breznakiella homolactica]|uniref:ABC transporter ATP-binding protein n=1 Tax=Breznakiella homolactica TaxID=2798577 RepID=A0A7T8B9Z4_9SPIR|nr:ABC transporter ATP-binding protein [Breznakiella homolactica]QQO08826.1 ABC transporter ATP-binding protein [Breznakiella homolactica]
MAVPILEVRGLKKYFKVPSGLVHAVDDVDLKIDQLETLGVVGESGCGKSTLGRVLLGLLEATEGEVLYNGESIFGPFGRKKKPLYSEMQMIFQDPFSSLNPRLSVQALIAEPIYVRKTLTDKNEIKNRVLELMDIVGLSSRYVNTYPHELDGGKRQRVGVARALALNPKFIVCDEPVSALDVSIQAQILNLIMDLQEKNGLAYMFITHNLCVVKHISTNIMVMYMGKVVEYTEKNKLFEKQFHPYSQALLSAVPLPVLDRKQERIILSGEVTNPINPKPGCRFAPRCKYCQERCKTQDIPLIEVEPGRKVACVLYM